MTAPEPVWCLADAIGAPGSWLALVRTGDWGVLALGVMLTLGSAVALWTGGTADRAVIRRDGRIVAELALNTPRRYAVEGALGTTVIEVQPGRARVLADPGPRQYCVQQGWLTRAEAVAVCAPSHISLQLGGRGAASYDSINY